MWNVCIATSHKNRPSLDFDNFVAFAALYDYILAGQPDKPL
jgi:hypothetical protein